MLAASFDSSDLALLISVFNRDLIASSASDLLLASCCSAAFALSISLLRLLEITLSASSALVYSYSIFALIRLSSLYLSAFSAASAYSLASFSALSASCLANVSALMLAERDSSPETLLLISLTISLVFLSMRLLLSLSDDSALFFSAVMAALISASSNFALLISASRLSSSYLPLSPG
mgnify:FL=1